jgi:chorismate-pyruvate lyase
VRMNYKVQLPVSPSEAPNMGWAARAQRPARLSSVDLSELSAEMRLLLLHDGTLTTALEAQILAPVTVEVEAQQEIDLNRQQATWLQSEVGTRAIRRRSVLRHGLTRQLLVQAESLVLPSRLPGPFLDVLAASPQGLGAAIAGLKLETRRELLWYGRTRIIAGHLGDFPALARCYRLIHRRQAVLSVEERFPTAET